MTAKEVFHFFMNVVVVLGAVNIANKAPEILQRCDRITKELGISNGFIGANGVRIWSSHKGTQLLEKLLPYICNTKQQARATIYLKFYALNTRNQPQRTLRLQLWKEWKNLIRKEYKEGKNRGPVPTWLIKTD